MNTSPGVSEVKCGLIPSLALLTRGTTPIGTSGSLVARALFSIVFCLTATAFCFAGTTYSTVMHTEAGTMEMMMTTRSWATGGKVKTLFVESQNPALPSGSYLLRTSAAILYMVDPARKTYSRWNLQDTFGQVSSDMRSSMKVQNARFEKLAEEDGGKVAGFTTRRYVFRLTYTMLVNSLHSKVEMPVTMDQEYWASDDPALSDLSNGGSFMQGGMESMSAMSPELEEMIAQQTKAIRGTALKSVLRITTKPQDMPEQSIFMNMEISNIRKALVPASTFRVPAGYKEVKPAVPPQSDPREQNPRKKPESLPYTGIDQRIYEIGQEIDSYVG